MWLGFYVNVRWYANGASSMLHAQVLPFTYRQILFANDKLFDPDRHAPKCTVCSVEISKVLKCGRCKVPYYCGKVS